MTLKLAVVAFLAVTSSVIAGKSPNADEILLKFPDASRDIQEDARLDVEGLLTKYGYPHETHEVRTQDDYILTMHRITGTKGEVVTPESLANKPTVFMMHGLLSSSADWINAGTDNGFGYLLADQGFDVWMGNARGNFYSRKHAILHPSWPAFWWFSWDEIGYYDLPAMIDRVLALSGKSKLHYIGHSQGTTTFFVMASRRPEYNNKIISMQAMAPSAYMSNVVSPLMRFLAPFAFTIEYLNFWFGTNEFLPNNELMTIAGDMMCKDNALFQPVCSNILFLMCGFNPDLHNATLLPILMGHTPAGASSGQKVHYLQLINSARFRRYDYGAVLNLLNYGVMFPPAYPLERITTPVYLHYGDNDWVADPADVSKLHRELGNSMGMYRVAHDKFSHLDFLWAIGVRPLVYDLIVEQLKSYH